MSAWPNFALWEIRLILLMSGCTRSGMRVSISLSNSAILEDASTGSPTAVAVVLERLRTAIRDEERLPGEVFEDIFLLLSMRGGGRASYPRNHLDVSYGEK